MHHLIVALHIGRDEDDFGAKTVPRVLEKLHTVRTSSALLGVPQNHALGFNVLMDETRDRRAECLFLVRADPDEEPVLALDASRQSRTNASARADADAALIHGRSVADAGKLELTRPDRLGRVADQTFSKVALDTANHVVAVGLAALADNAERVVLHERSTADAAQQALLHAALELEDGDLGRGQLDLDGHFAESDPRDDYTTLSAVKLS